MNVWQCFFIFSIVFTDMSLFNNQKPALNLTICIILQSLLYFNYFFYIITRNHLKLLEFSLNYCRLIFNYQINIKLTN